MEVGSLVATKRNKATESDDRFWVTTADASRFCGLTGDGFRKRIRPHLEERYVDDEGRGRSTWVYGPAVVEIRARQIAETLEPDGDAALLGGLDTPALERLRVARAKLAEMDWEERCQNLIPLAEIHDLVGRVASHVRRGVETLQRQCGPEAYEIMREALEDAERELSGGLPGKDESGAG